MDNCQIPVLLAYFLTIYTIGSIVYLFLTKSLGTPFYDSLTKEQMKIKKKAVSDRTRIFYLGLLIGTILMFIWKPFKSCNSK